MTEPLNSIHEVPRQDTHISPPASPSARRSTGGGGGGGISPIKDFSPHNYLRRLGGYQPMNASDGGGEHQGLVDLELEDTHRMQSPPLLPASPPAHPQSPPPGSGLGISLHSRTGSLSRVPVGARKRTPSVTAASSPATPRSFHGLLGSPGVEETIWETQDLADGQQEEQQQQQQQQQQKKGVSFTAESTPAIAPESPRQTRRSNKKTASSPLAKLFSARWSSSRKRQASIGVASISSPESSPGIDFEDSSSEDDSFDNKKFYKGYSSPPSYCESRADIWTRRTSWLSITIFALSIYSTVLSAIWFIVAVVQPRWGRGISSRHGLHPSTATTVTALVAKTIEMTFVTVFISFLGQLLTRRAITRGAKGMTLAEMTMRNWVIQPGSLITHGETLPTAGLTVCGMLALTATVAATFYTTASDAMVAPKIKDGDWEPAILEGHVRSSYANVQYASAQCASLTDEDEEEAANSCMGVQFSGQSYRNLMNFMASWSAIHDNATDTSTDLRERPVGTTLLFDNTTMRASWIETHTSNVTQLAAEDVYGGRIINNVSMAMPHPGVYQAATAPHNGILQPDDLSGVGEYSIRAAVVSPSINVMCVNMDADELAPLVYTKWEFANVTKVDNTDLDTGHAGWEDEVPKRDLTNEGAVWLNRTDVDHIFRWGPDYNRRPPVFQLLPGDYNMLTNSTVHLSDSIYILGKNPAMANYTLCELKSWVSHVCSTRFEISGITGASMRAHCEDPDDGDSYLRSHDSNTEWASPTRDWKWFADAWRLSMDLNGGSYYNNASNARIVTQLALTTPTLSAVLPSMAEALAVYASSTLVTGAIGTPFAHFWPYNRPALDAPGPLHAFNATLRTQQYTSGHVAGWQTIFYVVLALVLGINVFCLVYFVARSGLVTDFTEPQNIFALAVNSPPSVQLKGSCGAGPEKRDLVVPWRVAYAPGAHHFFFEEANDRPWKGKYAMDRYNPARGHDDGHGHGRHGHSHSHSHVSALEAQQLRSPSYKRLSSGHGWM